MKKSDTPVEPKMSKGTILKPRDPVRHASDEMASLMVNDDLTLEEAVTLARQAYDTIPTNLLDLAKLAKDATEYEGFDPAVICF